MKKRQSYSQLPYQPDNLKPHLDNIFGKQRERNDSLDKAIEIVERDLKTIKEYPSFINHDSLNKERDIKENYILFGTLTSILGFGGWCIYQILVNGIRIQKKLGQ